MFSTKSETSGRTLQAYSIYDSKGETFNPPFFLQAHGEAMRSLTQLVNDPKTSISQFPEDYTLFHVGTFDLGTGRMEPSKVPFSLGIATQFRQMPSRPSVSSPVTYSEVAPEDRIPG